jgi:cobalamin-dependent methionine synthase I
MDMGIVNAGQIGVYDDIPKDLLEHVEDVLLARRPDATERMVSFAEQFKGAPSAEVKAATGRLARRHGGRALEARAGAWHHRVHRSRYRRGPCRPATSRCS